MANRQSISQEPSGTVSEQPDTRFADLDPETIRFLTGIPDFNRSILSCDPDEMAKQLTVTFRPIPEGYDAAEVMAFRTQLRDGLEAAGAELVPWQEAAEKGSNGLISSMAGRKKISGHIDAVIDVHRKPSFIRNACIQLTETVYEKFLRSPDRSVRKILDLTAWSEYLPKHHVQDPFNTQIITLKPLDPALNDDEVSYDRKISIGLRHLINTMSEFVIGVSSDQFALVNMNMSDAVYSRKDLRRFLTSTLLPKLCAAVRPPLLSRFERGTFDPNQSECAGKLADLGARLQGTDLFPRGTKFNDLISRTSRRDVLDRYLDGRTGVSYGFLACVEPPVYYGPRTVDRQTWNELSCVSGNDDQRLRKNEDGRWYLRTNIDGEVQYKQVPDLWVATSRSGCDKTDLDPDRDVVRIGVKQGTLHFQTPEGADLDRKTIRPSFDTYVIVANALATALYAPDMVDQGAPLLHFHGYPAPSWFRENEAYTGASNPSVSCGTVEAALLNFSGIYNLAQKQKEDLKLLCIVEPDHGVNILGSDPEYLTSRVKEGCRGGHIQLGGKFLRKLS